MGAPGTAAVYLRPRVLGAILFNLVPIAGVLWWGWSPFALLLLYWSENVIIGVRTLLSIIAAGLAQGGVSIFGGAFIAAFFTAHYGMFCTVHGMFVVNLFGAGAHYFDANPYLVAFETLQGRASLIVGFVAMALLQAIDLFTFIARGEARRAKLNEVMGAPYGRVVLLHVTLMLGGALLLTLGWPPVGIVILSLLKLAHDVRLEVKEEESAMRAQAGPSTTMPRPAGDASTPKA